MFHDFKLKSKICCCLVGQCASGACGDGADIVLLYQVCFHVDGKSISRSSRSSSRPVRHAARIDLMDFFKTKRCCCRKQADMDLITILLAARGTARDGPSPLACYIVRLPLPTFPHNLLHTLFPSFSLSLSLCLFPYALHAFTSIILLSPSAFSPMTVHC